MLKTFKRTVKISVFSRYFAGATALIYITLYAYAEIQAKSLNLPEYSVKFNDYYSLATIQNTMCGIVVLILIVSCILKDKFTRTKRINRSVRSVNFRHIFLRSVVYNNTT